jgi:hypothetical protein
MRHAHLTKAKKHIHTHPLVREDYDRKGSVAKKILVMSLKGLRAKVK